MIMTIDLPIAFITTLLGPRKMRPDYLIPRARAVAPGDALPPLQVRVTRADATLLAQAMAPAGVACVVRSVEDPLFGPLVAFGLGGVHVDVDELRRRVEVGEPPEGAVVHAERVARIADPATLQRLFRDLKELNFSAAKVKRALLDAIEVAPAARWLFTSGTPGLPLAAAAITSHTSIPIAASTSFISFTSAMFTAR